MLLFRVFPPVVCMRQSCDPTLSVHPMTVGHNRVYYHTRSDQPVRACEFHLDSEEDDAPEWLCQHYQRKLEEFTDVNQVGIMWSCVSTVLHEA